MQKGLFLKTTAPLDDGGEIIVPQFWVPHPDWFKDEGFLSLYNLSIMFNKEEAKRMVPPEKTPATSAILLRKKQLEEKKAAMAAKNAGAGSQVIPRSVASMQKRPAGNIPKPAAKVPRVAAPAPAAGQKEKTPDKDRPTTAGKSLQFTPHFEMVVESARPDARTQTSSGSLAAGGALTPQSEKDTTSSRPNYQQYAKRMVKTITRSEREAVPAVHTVNLDRITFLLVETLLRVDGLSVPLRKKQEEVRNAQKLASELIDVCQFNAISYDLETEQRKLQQEELQKKATAAGEASLQRVDELELQVKNLQTDLKALENADKENVNLRKDNSRLVAELANNQAALKKELEQEQLRLIAENEADCEERMKLTWSLIHPDIEYEYWNLRYQYASEVYEAKVLGTDPPPAFDEWVERNNAITPDGANQEAQVEDQQVVEQSVEVPVDETQQPEPQQQQQPQQQQP
ncbi:uncharacterized protein LOC110699831 [Chenopodium quinoa]|uniref:uncharacterized protein LOC110699831 n=1 Tax=Chenopodium quinoa TaxID=63459 RepID=UPI000B77B412|nr:uncharacterized protein LOC110699831 [Chenopodium quinoa]